MFQDVRYIENSITFSQRRFDAIDYQLIDKLGYLDLFIS